MIIFIWGDIMKIEKKLPRDFFSKYRENNKPKEEKSYEKIEEVKWNKDILSGKNKVVASLPTNKKML